MKPEEMSYEDHLAKQVGNREKAQKIIARSKYGIKGFEDFLRPNRKKKKYVLQIKT